ncbi:Eco57I restriction-modification methylase domain-containing protein [Myroides odoratus]|uniref:Eco57I restriction-modification methylase domain-containing protein n=1 Tax=Myroides odoratus TaxID=256 RepID=UPI0039AEE023
MPNNERATEAFELGSFTTSDDRIIGLYRINVKSNVWLERNKVSLRELLRNVYKYDVDGAIVVFVQNEKWRLSFISEIKVLNDEGEIIEQATEPKRFTYLLGEGEKVKTPSDRLSKLIGKSTSLQDILNAFSVEALNEEFYKIVQSFFYELVGGKIGKGKKVTEYGDGILQLPNTDRNVRQEFAVRLIGRTVFCWFLKVKKSDAGIALLPENLLSSNAAKHYNNYYHSILERLFFQTLNTPIDERMDNLPTGAEAIPFLNGGLFEANNEDYYKPNSKGNNQNDFGITDDWFLKFFEELEKYNFTIDENSVTEIEVSVDPEMLGRIFENLLAEIDPDSGETARKATGSFYTPREIVDYMATESLVQYIHNKTSIETDRLQPIFKMLEKEEIHFSEKEGNQILDALDQVKILDPACGSGAFPMGVLQKIVQALQKIDPHADKWKKRQIDRINNPIVKKQLKEKLQASGVEYARKIGVIQNSLYGVDIQPIAAEISKLRCFLSLIVDENIDETKPNRGIEPLPNLEFKFVTADTLINLPEEKQRSMFDNFEELQQLEDLRNEYIQSSGKAKVRVKEQFLKVQQKIAKDQSSLFADVNSKAYKLGNWNPFGNDKSDWFDPKWMFGVEKFDVVIGNPPYVDIKALPKEAVKDYFKRFETTSNRINLYSIFIERGIYFVSSNGVLAYIHPNSLLVNDSYQKIRDFILPDLSRIVKLPDSVFTTATVETMLLFLSKGNEIDYVEAAYFKSQEKIIFNNLEFIKFNKKAWKSDSTSRFNIFNNPQTINIIDKIEKGSIPLIDLVDFSLGITPYDKHRGHSKEIIETRAFHADKKLTDDYVPLISGKNIHHYYVSNQVKEYLKYGSWLGAPREKKFFEGKKIIVRQILEGSNLNIIAAYSEKPRYFTQIGFSLIAKKDINKLKFLTAILNSSLMSFYHRVKFLDIEKVTFAKILIANCKQFPIKKTESIEVFNLLIDKIIFILTLSEDKKINPHVPNNHIAQLFKEVVNAMVMELYFKEDFEKVGIEFIKYAERDFEHIGGKEERNQIEIIHNAYQKLREKENEIRNNLKLMDIKLADIVMPIKTAK